MDEKRGKLNMHSACFVSGQYVFGIQKDLKKIRSKIERNKEMLQQKDLKVTSMCRISWSFY